MPLATHKFNPSRTTKSEIFPWLSSRLNLTVSRTFWIGIFIAFLSAWTLMNPGIEAAVKTCIALSLATTFFFIKSFLRSRTSILVIGLSFGAVYLLLETNTWRGLFLPDDVWRGMFSSDTGDEMRTVAARLAYDTIIFLPAIVFFGVSELIRRIPLRLRGIEVKANAANWMRRATTITIVISSSACAILMIDSSAYMQKIYASETDANVSDLNKVIALDEGTYPLLVCAKIKSEGQFLINDTDKKPFCMHRSGDVSTTPDRESADDVIKWLLLAASIPAHLSAGLVALPRAILLLLGYATMAAWISVIVMSANASKIRTGILFIVVVFVFEVWNSELRDVLLNPEKGASVWRVALLASLAGFSLMAGCVRARVLDRRAGLGETPFRLGDSFLPTAVFLNDSI